jgi:HEAT repeat protein
VRRRALEAAAVYSHDPRINEAIEEAYWSGEHALKVSALYAMGRSLDRRWLPLLLEELQSEDPAYRYEAATACGELGAEEAVDELISLTSDPDRAVQGAAIAALGRIGGTLATNVLRRLARSTDPVVRDAAEEALAEAVFASDPLRPTPW